MDRRQVLDAVRRMLADKGADAVIVPSNDCHFGEYVPDCFKVREWLSGFDGSAGTLVVTTSEAALWTDSRYFIQAARQLEGSGIALMKLKIAGTPSIPQWLHSQNVAKVIVDGDLSAVTSSCRLAVSSLRLSLRLWTILSVRYGRTVRPWFPSPS